jgi:transposase
MFGHIHLIGKWLFLSNSVHSIALATDALGNALRFILTGGERNDITQAEQLIENFAADYVIADKGYDAEPFIIKLKELNTAVVIPSRVNRKEQTRD